MSDKFMNQRACTGLVVLLLAATAWPQEARRKVDSYTQQDVGKALQGRIDFLLSAQLPEGNWPPYPKKEDKFTDWTTAPTSIAVYALIEAGISAKDPRIVKALDWLAKNQDTDVMIYSMGFRCNTWLAANKQTKNQYMKNLQKDVELLLANALYYKGGGSDYMCESKEALAARRNKPVPQTDGMYCDNSNAQYVLLAIWAGHRGGMEIPKEFWDACLKRWLTKQGPDGGWCYTCSGDNPSWGAMSTAGLASLFVCIDASLGDRFVKCNVSNEYAPIKRGLDWFDANFEKTLAAPWRHYDTSGIFFPYYMYGIERVGLASGYKYFGKSDWFKEGTKRLLAVRMPEKGAGVDSVVESAYILLFLARGSRPVLFNRLEYDGVWNNRPRALANLCRL
ncbi:MAG: terpene cyclase/mutase family protein, partial [Planctomycetes bacterium]|nr:terpene cyclase/mutase family protein [Planctomycetota bacterium]